MRRRAPPPVKNSIDPEYMRWMKGLDVNRKTTELLRREPDDEDKKKKLQPKEDDDATANTSHADHQQSSPANEDRLRSASQTASSPSHQRVLTADELKARTERDERHHKVAEALGKLRAVATSPGRRRGQSPEQQQRGNFSPPRQQLLGHPRYRQKQQQQSSASAGGGGGSSRSNRAARRPLSSTFPHALHDGAISSGAPVAFPQSRSTAAMRCYARGFQKVVVEPMASSLNHEGNNSN